MAIESDDIRVVIGRLIQQAKTEDTTHQKRADLFDRFMGEPYGDEQDGRSKFISTDAADVVESMLPDLLDVFTSAEDLVTFEPEGPEDEEAAKQETDVVKHIFWQKNNGFLTLYTWLKEALIAQNSYVKSKWVEKERVTVEAYEDLTPDELMQIVQQLEGDYEFLELEGLDQQTGQPIPESMDEETGEPQFAPISAKIRCTKVEKKYAIECVPQEEILLTPRWPSISIEGIPCIAHRREMEKGELRRMGFSEESIDKAADDSGAEDWQEAVRHDTRDHFSDDTDREGDESTRQVTVYEAYIRADLDGDGKAEQLQVWTVGDGSTLLEWEETGKPAIEECSHHPFSAFTPYIVPHRHVGRSAVEQVDDIQQVKTVLIRHLLDNTYSINYARPIVVDSGASPETYEDLMNPAHGAPIRVEQQGAIEYTRPQSVADTVLPMLETFDNLKEMRTGAVRYNQGLDSESLNKTATGIQKIMDASMKRRQLVARIFAETGLRDLFLRIHRDLRNGPMRELAMKLNGEWVSVNPRVWKERTDMTVQVGMGSGDRDQRREGLMLMGNLLEKLMMDPEMRQSGVVGYPQIRAVAEKTMETYGFENVEPFLPDPASIQQPEEEQGPSEQEQMQQQMMQAEMMRLQAEAQKAQVEAQVAQTKAQAEMEKIEIERQKAAQDMQIRMQQEQREARETEADILSEAEKRELERQKAVMEDDFKRDKLELDTATGLMRQKTADGRSSPPMGYNRVLNGVGK